MLLERESYVKICQQIINFQLGYPLRGLGFNGRNFKAILTMLSLTTIQSFWKMEILKREPFKLSIASPKSAFLLYSLFKILSSSLSNCSEYSQYFNGSKWFAIEPIQYVIVCKRLEDGHSYIKFASLWK